MIRIDTLFASLRYCINYLLLNVVACAIPHPKLRARYLSLLGASIGKNVRIENVTFIQIQYSLRNLHCGNNVFIGSRVILDLSEKIILDDFSIISPGSSVFTHQNIGDFNDNIVSGIYKSKYRPVHLKKYAVVCCDSTILAGSIIGCRSVVGAKSLINGEVPDDVLFAGVPAKLIRHHSMANKPAATV